MNDAPTVLVIEDDEDDFFLTSRVLRRFTKGAIFHVPNGRDALDYLFGADGYSNRAQHPFPDIVLLDLKMVPVTGHEVLAAIREKGLTPLPRIYVLTGSNEPKDRERVNASRVAAGYIVKPLTNEHLKMIFGGG
jgi:CheY-like chemotaxis protein